MLLLSAEHYNIVKNCLTNSNLLAFLCQSGLVA
jgi:hypothetical protein